MEITEELLKTGITPTIIIIILICVCKYLWKCYERYIKFVQKQTENNSKAINEINEQLNNYKELENLLQKTIKDLNSQLEYICTKFDKLENICIVTNNINSNIIKDIESIKKSIEIYQIIETLKRKH